MQINKFLYAIKLILYFIKRSKWFVILLAMLQNGPSYAQSLLTKTVNMPDYENIIIQEIMDEIMQKENIFFSYNSNLLNTDSLVRVPKFQGIISEYLEKLIGNRFFLKESGKHIIITYGPRRMGVDVDWIDKPKNGMIIGVIRDVRTNKLLPNASVYEKMTYQSATLSNKDGYFELNIKYPEQIISITLSKENYRDTTITLILPIEISRSKKNSQTGYYDRYSNERSVYESYYGSIFSNSKQRLQSINLGGFFAYSPFQVSLTPGLSTHGFINSQIVNNFSLNVIGGSTAGVEGYEMAGIFNLNQYNMDGIQIAGVINMVGGSVKGFQMAGLGNLVSRNTSGFQIAGAWNKADNVNGMQLAGVLNIAKKVKGVQFAGLLNIADSSDYPIAVLNIIKNGKKEISVQVDESKFLGVGFRTGGRILYSNLGFGMLLNNEQTNNKYGYEFGLGGYIIQKPKFSLAAEINQRNYLNKDFKSIDASKSYIRIIPTYIIKGKYQLFIAPTINYTEVENPEKTKKTWNIWKASNHSNSFHGGVSAGFSYRF